MNSKMYSTGGARIPAPAGPGSIYLSPRDLARLCAGITDPAGLADRVREARGRIAAGEPDESLLDRGLPTRAMIADLARMLSERARHLQEARAVFP